MTHFRSIEQGYIMAVGDVADVANGDQIQLYIPYAIEIRGVAVRANAVTNPADGDCTVDVQDDGTSILSAALSVAAVDTTYKEELTTPAEIAAGSILTIVFALTGTAPALSQVGITIW